MSGSNNSLRYYAHGDASQDLKCCLVAASRGLTLVKGLEAVCAPYYPALVHEHGTVFGGNAICLFLNGGVPKGARDMVSDLLELEELSLQPELIRKGKNNTGPLLATAVGLLASLTESHSDAALFAKQVLYSSFASASEKLKGDSAANSLVCSWVNEVSSSPHFSLASELLKSLAAPSALSSSAPTLPHVEVDIVRTGLVAAIKTLFSEAIGRAFPSLSPAAQEASVSRCNNSAFGDFQCNSAMGLAKLLKSDSSHTGAKAPKDIAGAIVSCLCSNNLIDHTSIAPNGFINVFISSPTLVRTIAEVASSQALRPPSMDLKKVLVDFSSPNIAKEMHVGHLRSTIIGDSVCRMLEFCGHDVLRVNHVGDWGTQFGMLISYFEVEFPDLMTSPPNISDLTVIYKAAKKKFDEDESFKEKSRLNVVKLQSGDATCRKIWTLICDISRIEFQRVYDALGIRLEEVGESFYNPLIPAVIEELMGSGLIYNEDKLLLIKLDHFEFPLILRKSDGGYGYDSTDMAAIKYRLHTLERDWVVYITDAGQASHFYKVFDAAKAAQWVQKGQRLDHIGFGVVCGEDGKRIKTRSGESVKLMDLLTAAKDRMRDSLIARAAEKKTTLEESEIEEAASIIGFGAVKYFDLKQHPSTNYVFNYDRMLDTKGDTAVYLLFAYARLASILRKGKEAGSFPTGSSSKDLSALISLGHEAERTLAFELLQFSEVLRSCVQDLMPSRLCDYLKDLCVKFTDFVTKCHVLGSPECVSRLLLCEATRRTMAKCFDLLGIGTLERI